MLRGGLCGSLRRSLWLTPRIGTCWKRGRARTPAKTLAKHDGAAWVRRILGVLSVVKKHGPAAVEETGTAALELGVPTYHFLKGYLDRRPSVPLTLRQVDPLIRQLTRYRDLIDRRIGDGS